MKPAIVLSAAILLASMIVSRSIGRLQGTLDFQSRNMPRSQGFPSQITVVPPNSGFRVVGDFQRSSGPTPSGRVENQDPFTNVSNVWLVIRTEPGDPPTIHFVADSDSQIVRGLVAILLMLCSGRSAREILAMNVESIFDRLELGRHLSRSRSNGLHSMIKRIRRLAEQQAN